MTDHERMVMYIAQQSAVYVPLTRESMRIDYCETGLEPGAAGPLGFYATGEDTGTSYKIPYSEVDVCIDAFYQLQRVNPIEAVQFEEEVVSLALVA